jgi:phosphate-selective porin OprO and OprP
MKRVHLTLLMLMLLLSSVVANADDQPQLSISAGKGGFLLTSPDGDFVLKIRGYIQSDGRFFLQDQPSAIDTFTLRRVRPVFEGVIYKIFAFKLMPDFGGGQTVIQDAYMDAMFHPAFNVRFGKEKGPVGMERLQSARDIVFVERSLATNLVPNRDIGIHVYGNLAGDKVTYDAAVQNGVVDGGSNDADSGSSKDAVARIVFRPIKGLTVGIGGSTGQPEGTLLVPQLPNYKTSGQQTFFKYRLGLTLDTTTIADGDRTRYSPQATYYHGPVGILAEYVVSSQKVRFGLNSTDIRNKAWNITVQGALTGEPEGFTGLSPKNPFDVSAGHWGAFEVAARYDELDIDNDAFPIFADPLSSATKAKNWTVGLNWYFNKNFKWVFNYDQTDFEGGNLPTEKLFLTRFQVAF